MTTRTKNVKTDNDLYEITIAGEYYCHPVGNVKAIKMYKIKLKMSGASKKAGFLSVARNTLLPLALKQAYPDYKRFRTHEIVNAINLSKQGAPPSELSLMNRRQLVKYINERELPIYEDLYPKVSELRQAVREWREDADEFERRQTIREAKMGPSIIVEQEVRKLNPELFADDEAQDNTLDKRSASVAEYDKLDELDNLIGGL